MARHLRHQLISIIAVLLGTTTIACADEGGVSFWVPGFFGSLAASPLVNERVGVRHIVVTLPPAPGGIGEE